MARKNIASERWLYGPIPDMVLGCGVGYAGFFVLEIFAGEGMRALIPLSFAPLIALVSGTPHYGATLIRTYEHREDRRAYTLFTVWMSLALAIFFVAGLHFASIGALLITIYLTWSPWHYSGQNYGIALMFLRRRGVPFGPGTKRIMHASFVLSYVLTLLAVHGALAQESYAPAAYGSVGYHFINLGIPAAVQKWGMLITGAAYSISVVWVGALLLRQASLRDLAPVAMIFLTQALWFSVPTLVRYGGLFQNVEPLSLEHAAYAFLWVAAGHSIQYLWITSYYARRSGKPHRQKAFLAKSLLAGAAIWTVPALIFAPTVLGRLPFESGLDLMIAAAVNIHHFILDGAIWKLRNGRIANVLIRGIESDRPEPVAASSRYRLRPWIWAAGVLSVGVITVGTLEQEYGVTQGFERGDIGRVRTAADRLAWLGQDSPRARTRLGLMLAQEGEAEAALDEIAASLALAETPNGLAVLGDIHNLAGRPHQAIQSYRQALSLAPGFPGASNNLAWMLATHADTAIRRPDEAIELAQETLARAGSKPAQVLDTLAAAYAAAGRFDEARKTAEQAEKVASATGDDGLAARIASRKQLYIINRAYIQVE